MTVTVTKASLLLDSANEAVDRARIRHQTNTITQHPLLACLTGAETKALVKSSQWISASAGDILAVQGGVFDGVVFLTEGKVREEIADATGGQFRAVINILSAGDEIGLLSLIDGAPHHATAVAMGRAEGLKAPAKTVARLFGAHPEMYESMARIAVERMRASSLWVQALV